MKNYSKFIKFLLVSILFLFLVERAFIFYLGIRALNNDTKIVTYLQDLPPEQGTGRFIRQISHECREHQIGILYFYKICGRHLTDSPITQEKQFVLQIQKPAPIISFVSRRYGDRAIWDSVDILKYNRSGEIVQYIRSN